ncbi:hypothetical protein MTR_6g045317 [Medicago truncatula]|uniref:Uncharacterized protein n=1 Tax=Medicago truncatula TaxID=3880 RepID=A0A072U9N4_MEDTR|nr:hypothetical protein MTR_6g045317 [Medicago truncatula]
MHVVPTRASSPQHKIINTLIGHQALNIRAKAHRASSLQRKEQRLTGHQTLNLNEYAWTQQLTTWTTWTTYMNPILWNNILQLNNMD